MVKGKEAQQTLKKQATIDLNTKEGIKKHFSMFRFEKIELKNPIDKTEEEPAASITYSDNLEDNLTVVNIEEKVTVEKFENLKIILVIVTLTGT